MNASDRALVARLLRVNLAVTLVTAVFSEGYFHIDEYFQILELVRFELGQVGAWCLPWEHGALMRPWLQPFAYWLMAKPLTLVGVQQPFLLAMVARVATGLASWGALLLFVRATVPWFASEDEKKLHVRAATLLGFLPYLFVRTSSETASMAAVTAGVSLALLGSSPVRDARDRIVSWSVELRSDRALAMGLLLGLAFELRFQSAFLSLGFAAWVLTQTNASWRAKLRALASALGGAAVALGIGALVDRWGYGVWTFPAWTYLQANMLEGAAALFGSDPPFAYLWLLPANLFFPLIVTLMGLSALAYLRNPRNPMTWTTLPFVVVHNLIAHKEERFLFPMAIFATSFVALAMAPSAGRSLGVSRWLWRHRRGVTAKMLAGWSVVVMALLALWPVGWHHHVRFQHQLYRMGDGSLRAYALPEFDLGLPAFHGSVYDVQKLPPEMIVAQLETPEARSVLVADTSGPDLALHSGSSELDRRATLVWSEAPFHRVPLLGSAVLRVTAWYDEHAGAPLRPIQYRSLYLLNGR